MPGSGVRNRPTSCLDDVLCTEELRRRPSRPPDYAAENRALAALAEAMTRDWTSILQKLVDAAHDLCRADSAGVNILERDGDREMVRWHAIAGRFSVNAGGAVARDASPCGTVLDRDAVLLFTRPGRHFADPVSADPSTVEALVVPFHVGGRPVGTVWVIAHTEERLFDAEDARLLESLSRFAATAYQMTGALAAAEAGRAELERRVAERTGELSAANDALRESEDRLKAALVAGRMATWHWYPEIDRVITSDSLEEILGLLNGETFRSSTEGFKLVHPEDEGRHRALVEAGTREGGGWHNEFRIVRPRDGRVVWVEERARSTRDPHTGCLMMTGLVWDITERKQAEAALRETEERLQFALSAAGMGVWSWDLAADTLTLDANLNRVLGLAPMETKQPSRTFLDLIHPDDRAVVSFAFDGCAKWHRPVNVEFRIIRPDGAVRWLRHQGRFSGAPEGGEPRVTGASVDITDLMETEKALKRARHAVEHRVAARTSQALDQHQTKAYLLARKVTQSAARLARTAIQAAKSANTPALVGVAAKLAASSSRAAERSLKMLLASDALQAQAIKEAWMETALKEVRRAIATNEEEQRRRISRELHDQLGQLCASLIIGLDALETRLPDRSDAVAQLERLGELARVIDDDLHRIALELRPAALDDIGLDAALLNYLDQWAERAMVMVDYNCQGLDKLRPRSEVETAIFRIVQEALTNVQKHARARRVGIILRIRGNNLVVIVEDDGQGFDPAPAVEAAAASRLGMRGMRERAALVGGELEVESAPGRGTTVYVRIPLRPETGATTDA
jgi:PAS domain S-box-containing protein